MKKRRVIQAFATSFLISASGCMNGAPKSPTTPTNMSETSIPDGPKSEPAHPSSLSATEAKEYAERYERVIQYNTHHEDDTRISLDCFSSVAENHPIYYAYVKCEGSATHSSNEHVDFSATPAVYVITKEKTFREEVEEYKTTVNKYGPDGSDIIDEYLVDSNLVLSNISNADSEVELVISHSPSGDVAVELETDVQPFTTVAVSDFIEREGPYKITVKTSRNSRSENFDLNKNKPRPIISIFITESGKIVLDVIHEFEKK